MKNQGYKIVFGYDAEDCIQIDGSELEKAVYAHMTGKDAAYSGGTVSGKKIIAIQPDYHRAMGWNRGHRLGPDDYAELSSKGVERMHMDRISEAKDRVRGLMSSGQEHLIGKGEEYKKLTS